MHLFLDPIVRPECRLPFVNSPHVFLEGHRCLAAMNISDEGRDTRIFLVNVDTLESESVAVPDAQWGPYGFVQGTDGKLYAGFFYGRIYSFDPVTKKFECKADPFVDDNNNRLTWGGAASRAGRIYMGVYPTGEFTEYEIATGNFHTISPLEGTPFGVYANQFTELPDGRMMVMLYGAHGEILIYNPATQRIEARREITCRAWQSKSRSLCLLDEHRVIYAADETVKTFNFHNMEWEEDFLPEAPDKLFWIRSIQGRLYAAGTEAGEVYEVSRSGCRRIETGLRNGNRAAGGIHSIGPDRFACLGDNGLFARFSTATGPLDTVQLDNRSSTGMNINSLRKDPGSNRLIGSHFITSQIFQADLETGTCCSSLDKVVAVPGQITCSVFLDGVAYLGVYGKALILAWRPEQPLAFGENPRLLCKIGHEQNRPMALYQHDGLLYTVTRANYGQLGGAISAIDPVTGACEVYRNFVPTQNPVSLFQHGAILVGTTEIYGDQGSCPPEATQAVLFSWDTVQRRTTHTFAPWEEKSLRALGVSPSGVMIGFGSGQYFLYRVGTGDCTVHPWGAGDPGSGVFLDERRFLTAVPCGANKTRVFVLDVTTHTVTDVGETEGLRFFELLNSGDVLASIEGSLIARIKLHDH
jgi:hypothetical protein